MKLGEPTVDPRQSRVRGLVHPLSPTPSTLGKNGGRHAGLDSARSQPHRRHGKKPCNGYRRALAVERAIV